MTRPALSSLRGIFLACALLLNGCTNPEIHLHSPRAPEYPPAGLNVTTSNAASEAPAELLVTGLGRNNEFRSVELRIRLVGAPALNAAASVGFIFEDRSRTAISLSDHWRHDAHDHSLVISAAQMAKLLDRLPQRQVSVMLGLADGAGGFAFGANFKAMKRAERSTPA